MVEILRIGWKPKSARTVARRISARLATWEIARNYLTQHGRLSSLSWEKNQTKSTGFTGLMHRSKSQSYSITSSARASSIGGIERLRGLEVDHQLELGRPHHRQIGRLLAFENPPRVDARLAKRISQVGSVAHQPATSSAPARIWARPRRPHRSRVRCWRSGREAA